MPQETKSTAPLAADTAVQGLCASGDDEAQLRRAIDLAFDYRGDVTILRRSTGESIEGYMFDRRASASLRDSIVRVIPSSGSGRVVMSYADIAELRFTGRDTAAGKSFETWMKKYVQKKLAGEAASIESEPLES